MNEIVLYKVYFLNIFIKLYYILLTKKNYWNI